MSSPLRGSDGASHIIQNITARANSLEQLARGALRSLNDAATSCLSSAERSVAKKPNEHTDTGKTVSSVWTPGSKIGNDSQASRNVVAQQLVNRGSVSTPEHSHATKPLPRLPPKPLPPTPTKSNAKEAAESAKPGEKKTENYESELEKMTFKELDNFFDEQLPEIEAGKPAEKKAEDYEAELGNMTFEEKDKFIDQQIADIDKLLNKEASSNPESNESTETKDAESSKPEEEMSIPSITVESDAKTNEAEAAQPKTDPHADEKQKLDNLQSQIKEIVGKDRKAVLSDGKVGVTRRSRVSSIFSKGVGGLDSAKGLASLHSDLNELKASSNKEIAQQATKLADELQKSSWASLTNKNNDMQLDEDIKSSAQQRLAPDPELGNEQVNFNNIINNRNKIRNGKLDKETALGIRAGIEENLKADVKKGFIGEEFAMRARKELERFEMDLIVGEPSLKKNLEAAEKNLTPAQRAQIEKNKAEAKAKLERVNAEKAVEKEALKGLEGSVKAILSKKPANDNDIRNLLTDLNPMLNSNNEETVKSAQALLKTLGSSKSISKSITENQEFLKLIVTERAIKQVFSDRSAERVPVFENLELKMVDVTDKKTATDENIRAGMSVIIDCISNAKDRDVRNPLLERFKSREMLFSKIKGTDIETKLSTAVLKQNQTDRMEYLGLSERDVIRGKNIVKLTDFISTNEEFIPHMKREKTNGNEVKSTPLTKADLAAWKTKIESTQPTIIATQTALKEKSASVEMTSAEGKNLRHDPVLAEDFVLPNFESLTNAALSKARGPEINAYKDLVKEMKNNFDFAGITPPTLMDDTYFTNFENKTKELLKRP
jgi:hypothetical protein